MTTDHIGIHQKLIENAVSHLTWHESAVAMTGFKAISQVWIEPPAWLFWLKGVRGAFMLRITEAEQTGEDSYCSYLLHYFPESTEKLSSTERELLSPNCFDFETNTPKYEYNSSFHNYFIIAEAGFTAADSNSVEMAVISRNGRFDNEADRFFDFLLKTVNYFTKSAHISCLKDKEGDTLLLPYSISALTLFSEYFEINNSDFEEIRNYKPEWIAAVDFKAECSVEGTCRCSH